MTRKDSKKRDIPAWASPGQIVYFKPEPMPERGQPSDPITPKELAYVVVARTNKLLLCVKMWESDGLDDDESHSPRPVVHKFDEETFFPTFAEALRAAARIEQDYAGQCLQYANILEKWASEHEVSKESPS